MTTKTQSQPASQLDQDLHETEFGSFIAKNKSLVIGLVVGILIAIVAQGFYKQSSDKTNDSHNQKIFEFKENSLIPYTDKKIKSDELMSGLNTVSSELGAYSGLNLLLFSVSDELVKQNELDKALVALNKVTSANDPFSAYFLATRKAAVLEDLNKPVEALAALESLSESSKKLLEGKVYLDIGRLQFKNGDKVKARKSFEYLKTKIVQDEFSKLANYYLYQLDKVAAPASSTTEKK